MAQKLNFVLGRVENTVEKEKMLLSANAFTLFKSVPNNKFLAWSKLKTFADDKLDVVKMMISVFDRLENTMGKGKSAGYQHFHFFRQCSPNPSSLGLLKVGIVW